METLNYSLLRSACKYFIFDHIFIERSQLDSQGNDSFLTHSNEPIVHLSLVKNDFLRSSLSDGKLIFSCGNTDCFKLNTIIDWFDVSNWFLMSNLLGNLYLPRLLKEKNKPLKIRQLWTMHRALTNLETELIDADGQIITEGFVQYLTELTRGRSLQLEEKSTQTKYCHNLTQYIKRAITPYHKVTNWFILVSRAVLSSVL